MNKQCVNCRLRRHCEDHYQLLDDDWTEPCDVKAEAKP